MVERKRHGRKLLIASIGVAAVSYVACGGDTNDTSGNLVAPNDAGASGSANTGGGSNTGGNATTGGSGAGNTGGDSSTGGNGQAGGAGGSGNIQDAAVDKTVMRFEDVLVANLIAPPPPDAKGDTK